MSVDLAAGNRPHTRPEFDQIRFNCAADRSPNVLEIRIRNRAYVRVRAWVYVRLYAGGCVTRYDIVSRDNAGMQGDRRIARDGVVYEEQTRSAVSHDEVE